MTGDQKIQVPFNTNLQSWHQFVWALFPRLREKDFVVVLQDQQKNETVLDPGLPSDIRDKCYKGCVFIREKVRV